MVVQQAFGRWQFCWHPSQNRLDGSIVHAVPIIVSCPAPHNLCDSRGEPFALEQTHDSSGLLNCYTQPESAPATTGRGKMCAAEIKDASCTQIWTFIDQVERGNITFMNVFVQECQQYMQHYRCKLRLWRHRLS